MRDTLWILGILLVFVIVSAPWVSMFSWVRERRGKKYKSHEDVI